MMRSYWGGSSNDNHFELKSALKLRNGKYHLWYLQRHSVIPLNVLLPHSEPSSRNLYQKKGPSSSKICRFSQVSDDLCDIECWEGEHWIPFFSNYVKLYSQTLQPCPFSTTFILLFSVYIRRFWGQTQRAPYFEDFIATLIQLTIPVMPESKYQGLTHREMLTFGCYYSSVNW